MIQLIGLLLCVYMLVRGLDILSRVEDRKSRNSISNAKAAAWIAIGFAIVFTFLFIQQGNAMPSPPSL